MAAAKVGNPQTLQFASTTLCPAGAAPAGAPGGNITAPSCVLVTVFNATNLLQFGMGSREQKITAGGLEVHVFPDDHSAYAKMNDRLAVTALGPPDLTDPGSWQRSSPPSNSTPPSPTGPRQAHARPPLRARYANSTPLFVPGRCLVEPQWESTLDDP